MAVQKLRSILEMTPPEGVEDDGYPRGLTQQELDISYTTLKAMASAVNATIQPLREMPACRGRVYVVFRISRICLNHLSYTDLRIAGKHERTSAVKLGLDSDACSE